MKPFHLKSGALILLSSFFITACTKDDKAKTMSDDIFYKEIGYCLAKSYSDIYNQNLAGKPVGAINMTTPGPMGGTVVITGTTTQDASHDITGTDLLLNLTAVPYSTTTTNITQSGIVSYKGSFSPTYNNTSHLSDNITLVGKVTSGGVTREINQSGAISINVTKTNVSATIFGHNVNW